MTITPEKLASIKVLYRRSDSLCLYGIPYKMREGQQPGDLWRGRTIPDTVKAAQGWYGATISAPGPREDWIWLGSPGWWGRMTGPEILLVKQWLSERADIPGNPNEWCEV